LEGNPINLTLKISNSLIGIAGVHFVASELTLRGLIALPTIRNTAGIDILVSEPDGSGQANLQVKTSLKKVTFWPTSKPEKCLRGPTSFYVFLRYDKNQRRFEAFLESGDKVYAQVTKNMKDYKKRGLAEFPYWYLPPEEKELDRLRKNWETWEPPIIYKKG
jgi:hypothetical protein